MKHIAGDSLEHSRIRLERDIDNNIPSPPSMSLEYAPDDDEDVSSVDYPRHNSQHRPSFHSFEHASHLDSDFYSRHGDDEDSIALDPDLGYTMSTAAHHASALTLSAGLRGRGAYNQTSGRASPSGAEYDPDRPLQTILNNRIADGISLFDATLRSKSQNQTRTVPSFDPLVVDSTAELDRLLRTGHRRPAGLVYPYQSRSHSQPASDTSDLDPLPASPTRLSHALGRDFSPKRPRSAPVSVVDPPSRTTKPKSGPSHLNPTVHPSKPEKSAQPPNRQPSRADVHARTSRDSDPTLRPARKGAAPAAPRAPFSELSNKHARIHLPDVTGLTSAVQSPDKKDALYINARVSAARTLNLLPALDALHTRLQAVERANGVSRRRVRELEHELEECRAEVIAERTRIEERERETAHAKAGRHRAVAEERYRTVVAEKKALEALLASLRTHLARLTAELTTHKTLLESLRTRDGNDVRAEIQALRKEVERLAGEVERLKAVVEEGLRERRRAKQGESEGEDNACDIQEMPAQVGIDLTYVTVPAQERSVRDEQLSVDRPGPGPASEDQESKEHQESQYDQDHQEHPNYEHAEPPDEQLSADRPDTASEDPESQEYQESQRVQDQEHPKYETQNYRTPFPQIRGSRMERLFFSAPEHNARTCAVCHRRKRRPLLPRELGAGKDCRSRVGDADEAASRTYLPKCPQRSKVAIGTTDGDGDGDRPPPQTVLARVVCELQDDFSHYKAIYLELAEQYGVMDAVSNVAKRNVLADHLRQVIDTLEQKGDQIASLSDLLTFQDKPVQVPRVH